MLEEKRCENCGEIHNGDYSSGRFCSSKCARGFSTKNKRSLINEKVSKSLTKDPYKKCISCKNNITTSKRSKYCIECKKYVSYKVLFEKMNELNENLLINNENCLKILKNLYFNEKMSKEMITNKFGILTNTIYNYFKLNSINLRTLSESVINSINEGRYVIPTNFNYKHGKHLTWENKEIYYRSSFELEYAKYLDDLKIKYDVEKLRIKYYDSQLKKERFAIPDFYLNDSNTIVEIKSEYTLNKQNMLDKCKAYSELGYNFKLILDKIEVKI